MSEQNEVKALTDNGEKDFVDMVFTTLSAVEDTPKEYAYNSIIPRGRMTNIGGDPGAGKTKFGLYVVAQITQGNPILGIPCEAPGNALVFSTEDDAADIKATVQACGGDTDKVFVLSEDDKVMAARSKKPITFASPIIEQAVAKLHPTVVLFDPYQKYIGKGVDTNRGNESSAAIEPVLLLAKRYNFALIVIQHFVKATDGLLHSRFSGSYSIIGDARSAIAIVKDPDNPSENLAIHVKSNNRMGKTIRYRIESIPGNEDCAQVRILGLEDYTERDYAAAERRRRKGKHETELTDNDVVIGTMLRLVEDNPSGLRIGRYDLQNCASAYFGEPISLSLKEIENAYGAYLASKHGIIIQEKPSQALRAFTVKGKIITPQKQRDRCMYIYRRGTPIQIEL